MATLYGISNCDTIKKARKWLADSGIDYTFHDYRKDGLDAQKLLLWMKELGWESLVNRRGTTWRQLPQEERDNMDEASALMAMIEAPALIKRPVLDLGDRRIVGFQADEYASIFKHHTL